MNRKSIKRLELRSSVVRTLVSADLSRAQGGFCVETDPNSTAGGGGTGTLNSVFVCLSVACPSFLVPCPQTNDSCQANSNCGCTHD